MANRIKGITIEIGGDTTKLQIALKSVNSEIKSTQSQLHNKSGTYPVLKRKVRICVRCG